ncbi:MAG: Smr/MutS family protein [Deltaproteobacteria bacterium]|jgi:DNA-nicking Smr family endonuclease|nr:Smr/MutS family protein [Deltaproteobacteria bacterium]
MQTRRSALLAAFFMGTMSEKDPFAEVNPFLRLKTKSLPRRSSPCAALGENVRQKQERARESVQDEESRLFLQAVSALPLKKQPSGTTSGFVALEESFAALRSPGTQQTPPSRAVPEQQDLPETPAKHARPMPRRRQEACDAHNAEPSCADEQARDFTDAMRDVRPLKSKGRDVPLHIEPSAAPEPPQPSFQAMLESTLEFALHFSEEYAEGHVVGLESLILLKLRAGQYRPEAHLDLHGLNARQAFDALAAFVRRSWHRGMRTLLLIPGRGKNSPDGVAVLRERVQSWLTQDPLKRVVLAFCTARPVDGGLGSLYVLLRKCTKKGKIYWERGPADLDT